STLGSALIGNCNEGPASGPSEPEPPRPAGAAIARSVQLDVASAEGAGAVVAARGDLETDRVDALAGRTAVGHGQDESGVVDRPVGRTGERHFIAVDEHRSPGREC